MQSKKKSFHWNEFSWWFRLQFCCIAVVQIRLPILLLLLLFVCNFFFRFSIIGFRRNDTCLLSINFFLWPINFSISVLMWFSGTYVSVGNVCSERLMILFGVWWIFESLFDGCLFLLNEFLVSVYAINNLYH